jgi:hypothetical protein
MNNQTKSRLSRRSFLLAAGVGGVATVAAAASRSTEQPKAVASNYNTTKV